MVAHECFEIGTYVLSVQWERVHYFHLRIKSLSSKEVGKHFTGSGDSYFFTEWTLNISALRNFSKGRDSY